MCGIGRHDIDLLPKVGDLVIHHAVGDEDA
jgi:hypothetical protein